MPKLAAVLEKDIPAALLRRGFPPFSIKLEPAPAPVPSTAAVRERSAGQFRPDAEIELAWQGRTRRFIAECRTAATPKQLEGALSQLRSYIERDRKAGRQRFPLLIAPYLSPATLERLEKEGISGIDLSGNGIVTIPGEWLVVKTGAENQYPSSAPIKNIYRGRSSLVCRALLLRPEYPSVGAIVEALRNDTGGDTGVTQATVSKVLKSLEEELLIARSGGSQGTSISLKQPGELLDRLAQEYVPPRTSQTLRGNPTEQSAARTPIAILADAARKAGVRYAVDTVMSYAPFPGAEDTPIYVESLAPIVDAGAVRENDRFATVRLIETSDPIAYFDTRVVGGVCRASPIQVYLELANGTQRERDISGSIRSRILAEAGANTAETK
jgi:DNA-binding transcriptional ArsR family regulator